MMKHSMLGFVFLMLMSTIALAETLATVSFTVPTPVVYGVPFSVGVNVDARMADGGAIPFTEFDLSLMSTDGRVRFTEYSPALFTVHGSTGAYPGGYRYYTIATGETRTSIGGELFRLTGMVDAPTNPLLEETITIMLDPQKTGTITSSIGYDNLRILSAASSPFTPALSRCGDGVVGYEDTNANGMRDSGERVESCDDGNDLDNDGCSSICWEELGWRCNNQQFGNRNSICNRLPEVDYFLEKISALLKGNCYPSADHPSAKFCTQGSPTVPITGGKITSTDTGEKRSQRSQVIAYFITEFVPLLRSLISQP